MMIGLLLLAIVGGTVGDCPPNYELWTNGKCYKFLPLVPNLTMYGQGETADALERNWCSPDKSVLPSPVEYTEIQYILEKLRPNQATSLPVLFPPQMPLGSRQRYNLYVPLARTTSAPYCSGHPTKWPNPFYADWEGNRIQKDLSCRALAETNGQPYVWSDSCNTRYMFVVCVNPGNYQPPTPSPTTPATLTITTTTLIPGPGYTCDPNAKPVGTKCVCNSGFTDIRDTDLPDRDQYRPCIDKKPCRNLKGGLTILFLMDASMSISQPAWPNLVAFVQSASDLLANSVWIGFIKFANTSTPVQWVESGWSISSFVAAVPSTFQPNGETNTPAAFEEALNAFKLDSNPNEVAVLITDGLPFTSYYLSLGATEGQRQILEVTQNLATRVISSGRHLVALGFGPFLQAKNGARNIKNWLESDSDYLEYKRTAEWLNEDIMAALLNLACKRMPKST